MHRVMVIDPDPSTEVFFKVWFGNTYEIDVVQNGKMALEQAAHFKPDVAITEIILPDMPGWLLVQALRKETPNLPVIAVAANESWNDARKMRIEAGPILFYAVKPLNQQEIQKLLGVAVVLQHRHLGILR
jgi:CheY-like chemotaxis protein